MLVLSRKENQAVRFPRLGITVQVVRVEGCKVRLGVDAPREVKILRDELCEAADEQVDLPSAEPTAQAVRHQQRNELNKARLGLALAQKQLECGRTGEAEQTLAAALAEIELLDSVATAAPLGQRFDSSVAATANQFRKPRKRALIVEDNENERELLAGYLRLSGFQVDTASNGLEAIKYLSAAGEDLPQAVVLDMKMPMLDGAKTVSSIRFRPKLRNLRLYAVSGSTPDEMSLAIGPKGVDHWFSKPVDPEELVRHISSDHDELAPGYIWPLGVSYLPAKHDEREPDTVTA